jgi:hypothetical protein
MVVMVLTAVISYCMMNYSSRLFHMWFLSTERNNFLVLTSSRSNILKMFWHHVIARWVIAGYLQINSGSLSLVVRWPLKRYVKVYS